MENKPSNPPAIASMGDGNKTTGENEMKTTVPNETNDTLRCAVCGEVIKTDKIFIYQNYTITAITCDKYECYIPFERMGN